VTSSTAVARPLSRAAWLKARQGTIGGTTIASIAGLNPYATAIDAYNQLCGLVPPVEANAMMERGRVLEHVVARMYAARTGRKIRKTPFLVHPEYPFLTGSPDREVLRAANEAPLLGPGLLEVKTHGTAAFARVKEEGVYASHVCQLQWYLGLSGMGWGSFAVFCPDLWDLIVFDIEADPDFYASLVALAVDFQRNHVEPRVPPALPELPLLTPPKVGGDAKVIDDEGIVSALQMYAEAKHVADEAQSALEMAKDNLRGSLPGMGSYKLPGATVTHTLEPGRRTIDKAALIAHGIDPTQFERIGESYPLFKVYLKKERK
jgi:putative phage-type endonuclease